MVKVITLQQPWAELVVMGAKKIETRSWNTHYRGELYIHASKRILQGDLDLRRYDKNFAKYLTDDVCLKLRSGCIIGKIDLIDTHSTNDSLFLASVNSEERSFGGYSEDRFGWTLINPVKFKHPIETAGALNLWNFDMTPYCTLCGKKKGANGLTSCEDCWVTDATKKEEVHHG